MCAKNMEDGRLEGLVEYLEVVGPILKGKTGGVWAVRRESWSPDGWNILEEGTGEEIRILKPEAI